MNGMTEMTDQEREERIADKIGGELGEMALNGLPGQSWMWASFCDDSLPEGSQFLGVVIAPGHPLFPAMFITSLWSRGLNPGGECAFEEIPLEHLPPPEFRMRLLNRAEAERASEF